MASPMRYVSLFSGIEAASVAWGPLGWEPVAFSEIEPFPCALLAERFPDVPNLGDVTEIDWSDYVGTVDLVVGGSPCQAFSVAGRRLGLVDGRGRLMLEYVRAVRELRPRWLLWENVPGVLSQSNGDAFETLQRELADCGYSLAWRTLDAQFYRVAQRRRRVFLVGHLGEDAYPAAVLFERESLRWDSPSGKAKRQELARAAGGRARSGGRAGGSAWAVDGNVCDRDARQNGSGVSEGVAPTLNTVDRHAVVHDGCRNPWDPQSKRVFGTGGAYQTLYAHGSGGHDDDAALVFDESQVASPGNRSKPGFGGPCHTLTTDGRAPASVIAFQGNASGSFGFGEAEELSPTLRAGASCGNQAPAASFKYHQGSKAGSAGADSDVSPTLTVDYHQPAICMSPFDPRATCADDVSVTVKANGHAPAVCFNSGNANDVASVGDGQIDLAPTLRASRSGTNGTPAVCMASTQANAEIEREMCPTTTARQHKDPPVLFARGAPFGAWRWPWIVRRLMPVECERLQGFPDGWTRIPYRGKPAMECPDTPRYKALGNSMAVPVMRWIGERIAMVDALMGAEEV